MKKILFVCIENSNRSQMAEAFAKMHGNKQVEAYSAGSNPSGKINPKAIQAMKEKNYDLNTHSSISIDEISPDINFDFLVSMGCGDACPHVPAKKRIEWDIPDPKEKSPEEFNKVRDLIEDKVKELLKLAIDDNS